MADPRERAQTTDLPEPDEALSSTTAERSDHEPSDSDDRVADLDRPDQFDPPLDEDDDGA